MQINAHMFRLISYCYSDAAVKVRPGTCAKTKGVGLPPESNEDKNPDQKENGGQEASRDERTSHGTSQH